MLFWHNIPTDYIDSHSSDLVSKDGFSVNIRECEILHLPSRVSGTLLDSLVILTSLHMYPFDQRYQFLLVTFKVLSGILGGAVVPTLCVSLCYLCVLAVVLM